MGKPKLTAAQRDAIFSARDDESAKLRALACAILANPAIIDVFEHAARESSEKLTLPQQVVDLAYTIESEISELVSSYIC